MENLTRGGIVMVIDGAKLGSIILTNLTCHKPATLKPQVYVLVLNLHPKASYNKN